MSARRFPEKVPNLKLPLLSFAIHDHEVYLCPELYRAARDQGGPIKLSVFNQIINRDGLPAARLWWQLDCIAKGESPDFELMEADLCLINA